MKVSSPPWLVVAALALIWTFATACNSAGPSSGEAREEAATPTPRGPQPTGYVLDVAVDRTNGWTRAPLSALSAQAAHEAGAFLGCCIGIAVAFPEEGVVYELNGRDTFEALSVGKVPLMLTMIDNAIDEDRDLTPEERVIISAMITQSDNAAADAAWNMAGGERKVTALLESAGATDGRVGGENWGEMRLSAFDAAVLLAEVVDGRLLDEGGRDTALSAMAEVVPWQGWGAGVGVADGAIAGVKNGWYLEPEGWAVHSLAYLIPDEGSPYTVSIFSLGMSDFYAAVAAIEAIARYAHHDIAN